MYNVYNVYKIIFIVIRITTNKQMLALVKYINIPINPQIGISIN